MRSNNPAASSACSSCEAIIARSGKSAFHSVRSRPQPESSRSPEMIRVLIVVSSAIGRAGLEALLERAGNIEVIGGVSDWERPDVIITDDEVTDEQLELHPNANVVVLTSDPSPTATQELL